MTRTDASIGTILTLVNALLFVYWMLWVAVTPFVDASHFTQKLFPPREYGIAIPVIIVSMCVVIGITTASLHIIRKTGLSDVVVQRSAKASHQQHYSVPPPLSKLSLSGDEEVK